MSASTQNDATRPLIVINGELESGQKRRIQLPLRYAAAIEAAGGLALVLPPLPSPGFLAELLERADGLVHSGGDDFDTERIGLGPTHPRARPVTAEKQDFDFELARAALSRGLPTLGICYGMQLLGLATGGRLHQHLPDDRPQGCDHTGGVRHDVVLEPGTKLACLFGVAQVDVVSRHHQALADVDATWAVAGRDPEGLIEAIEHREHPFAVGVQWHPELDELDGPQAGLFRGLVAAARTCAAERSGMQGALLR